MNEDARGELEAAIDAWNRYLDTNPNKPDLATASQIVQAYVLFDDATGAARTQEILAEADPSSGAFGTLANYLYADVDFKGGDAAAQRAIEEATARAAEVDREAARPASGAVAEAAEAARETGGIRAGHGGRRGRLWSSPFGGLNPDGRRAPDRALADRIPLAILPVRAISSTGRAGDS